LSRLRPYQKRESEDRRKWPWRRKCPWQREKEGDRGGRRVAEGGGGCRGEEDEELVF
jgi:hypothetical protein